MNRVTVFLLFAVMSTLGLEAGEPVDLQVVSRIRAEGLNNSKVMETLHQLTDVHGSRLTGSPGLASASAWCRDQLAEWGLVNSKLESWGEFGQGWSLEGFSLNMTAPYYSPLIGYPKAWTPGTQGRIEATPMPIEASNPEELKKYEGKLKGALVMFPNNREAETHFEADARRRSDEDLEKLVLAPEPGRRPGFQARRAQFRQRRQMRQKMVELLKAEGAVATLEASRGEHGTLFVGSGGSRDPEKEMPLPGIVLAIEHYNRIKRLLKSEVPVKIELEFQARYHQEDLNGYNVVAEIPGADPNLADELVMLGAHIDSWHAGTGATDNAAGVAVTMEAARIIQALDLKPRRTIRIGLWSGEEQGLLGSRAYVKNHFADRETMELKPAHDRFSAYFNLDNGTGKIRGIYLQNNDAVRPIFEAYLKPFQDLGGTTITIRRTGGTDHLAFDAVGLPGFQFVQDPIDYSTRTHHTNMDLYDHALAGDLMQASVIMASFVYHTAMRDEKLPRKALPEPQPEEERRQPRDRNPLDFL